MVRLETTCPESFQSLKQNYVKSTKHQADMRHLLHFKEHPDGDLTLSKATFDDFMGKDTQSFLEEVEAAKARLKAKSSK